MAVLGEVLFLMSEVPLYLAKWSKGVMTGRRDEQRPTLTQTPPPEPPPPSSLCE